ncbi:hypothetical protein KY348_02610 [Candidatus Woesearchaeota archaeon]|nr:hypothetical protein [Candidatus Woesearchaeota archaeon]
MAEKRIVYQDKLVSFEGLFNMKDLFRLICKWFNEHGYDMFENKNFEEVYEEGKKVICELIPYKKVTDYHKLEIRIFFTCENLKEVEVEIKGVKQKLLKGRIDATFDAILVTDYEGRWEGRPAHYFYRAIIDKFIYKSYTDKYEQQLIKEAKECQEEIKSYLNMFRYHAPPAKESPRSH